MNRMIVRLAAALCAVALAGCATATPAAVAPVIGVASQPVPATGSTTSPAATLPSAQASSAAAPAGSAALACASGSRSASATPELTEGPFFKASSPERASLLEFCCGQRGVKQRVVDGLCDLLVSDLHALLLWPERQPDLLARRLLPRREWCAQNKAAGSGHGALWVRLRMIYEIVLYRKPKRVEFRPRQRQTKSIEDSSHA